MLPDASLCCIFHEPVGARWIVSLEHVPKKLLDFFDSAMLQLFDFELGPYRSNDSI